MYIAMADSKSNLWSHIISAKDNPDKSVLTTFDNLVLLSLYHASKYPDDFSYKIDPNTEDTYFKLKDIRNYAYSLVNKDSAYKHHSSDNSNGYKDSADHFIAWSASHMYKAGMTTKLTDVYPKAPRGYHRINDDGIIHLAMFVADFINDKINLDIVNETALDGFEKFYNDPALQGLIKYVKTMKSPE